MKHYNIICIDFLAYSSTHTSVNSFWIESLLSVSDRVTFICEKNHWNAISKNFPFIKTILFKFRSKYYWYLVRDLLFFISLLYFRKSKIFIFGMTGTMVFILSLFERVYPRLRVTAILHSEVEGINNSKGINRTFCRFALNSLSFPSAVCAFVLGRHIYNNLKNASIYRKNLNALELPVPVFGRYSFNYQAKNCLKIAIIGVLNNNKKDLSSFAELAKYENVDCYAIGRAVNNFSCSSVIKLVNSKHHFSKSWMAHKLEDIDFLFLAPLPSQYQYTALGTVADGLEYGKFIAWIKHPSLVQFESCPLSIVGTNVQDLKLKLENFIAPSQDSIYSWFHIHNNKIKKLFLHNVEI